MKDTTEKRRIAELVLEMLTKQNFYEFYNGEFDHLLANDVEDHNKQEREKILVKIEKMLNLQ